MNGTIYCPSCATDYGSRALPHRCTACGGALSLAANYSPSFPRQHIAQRPATMWRYAEALPSFDRPISLGEPTTPLVPFQCGDLEVLAKCEHILPTGSYKDRGASLLMSYLSELGIEEAVEDSSGNAGAAMAAYAARAGLKLKVFCPASASAGKLVQIQLYSAELVRVEGPRIRATETLLEYVETTGAFYASHLWHPLFIEGIKTTAFEIAEQLDWSAPDVVLCPVGAGSILLGVYLGFKDLLDAGLIAQLPRLVAVQSHNVSPVYQAFSAGADHITPVTDAQPTLAEGIALPGPVRGGEILQALNESAGTVVTVSEENIAAGVQAMGTAGFCVEPTSAIVWHGVQELYQQGFITPNDTTVAVLSGHGLKAAQSIGDLLS